MTSFNVIKFNINDRALEPYDIIPYLKERYNKAKTKPKTIEEFEQFIKAESMYQWWSRCEYEILISDWPLEKLKEKWDIHKQVLMNIEVIANVLMKNVKQNKGRV